MHVTVLATYVGGVGCGGVKLIQQKIKKMHFCSICPTLNAVLNKLYFTCMNINCDDTNIIFCAPFDQHLLIYNSSGCGAARLVSIPITHQRPDSNLTWKKIIHEYGIGY